MYHHECFLTAVDKIILLLFCKSSVDKMTNFRSQNYFARHNVMQWVLIILNDSFVHGNFYAKYWHLPNCIILFIIHWNYLFCQKWNIMTYHEYGNDKVLNGILKHIFLKNQYHNMNIITYRTYIYLTLNGKYIQRNINFLLEIT